MLLSFDIKFIRLDQKRGMGLTSLAILMRFLVASSKLDIKRQNHDILYILECCTAVSVVLKKYDPLL